ncbi:hypothetical protein BH10BAC1_BH10BAC1_17120 [soil metagenome]
MKNRILSGWTFTRVLYLALGTAVVMNGIANKEWWGILLGGYFASMGLFAFGCASGNCLGGNCNVEPKQNNKTEIQEIKFEEIKQK